MRDKILYVYSLAALLGVLTGILGSFFQLAIQFVTTGMPLLFANLVYWGVPLRWGSALVSMGMVFVAWLMVRHIAPEAAGSGVQEIEGALMHERPVRWWRVLPVKFVGGVLAISAKMVLGREGPTIQMGGNLGKMVAVLFRMSQSRHDSLIAAGAAAGLATAFNAPLAGVLFVMEEMRNQFNFSFTNLSAVTICCVSATIILHLMIGSGPAITMDVFDLPSLISLWSFFVFGIVVGFVGLLFNMALMKSLYGMDKLSYRARCFYVLLIGFLVGYFEWLQPEAVGGGYEIVQQALIMTPVFSTLIRLIFIRFITTMLCYNTGVPGGIFAPMLALGTLLGLAAFHIVEWISPDMSIQPGMFAVAGMGALFAAAVRAPVTGIVLVVEMTQNYKMILPLMITCLTATIVVQLAKNQPIYTQLLRRTLKN